MSRKDSTIKECAVFADSVNAIAIRQRFTIADLSSGIETANALLQKALKKIERNRKARPWIIGGSTVLGAAAVKFGPAVIKMIFKR